MKALIIGLIASTGLASSAFALDKAALVAELESKGRKLAGEQSFKFRTFDEPSTLDPGLISDRIASDIARQLFEGLYEQNDKGETVPALAIGFDVSPDKKTYTFNLRQDAKWSDGRPVTAHDFVYAWRRVVDPATNSLYQWYIGLMAVAGAQEIIDGKKPVSELGVTAIDDFALEVRLDKPIPYFRDMLTLSTTYPVPRWAIEEHGEQWTRPENIVTNGAYQLKNHVLNEKIELTRNKAYWNNENTVLDEVTTLVINDENIAFTRYQAGELDKTDLPAGQYPRLKAQLPNETHVFADFCTYYYAFNRSETGHEALQDARVRKALSFAIDRSVLTEQVLKAGQNPTFTITPEFTAGFTVPHMPYTEWKQSERDQEARRLLEEAGYSKSNPLKVGLLYNTGEPHKKLAVTISAMWRQKLGVVTTLENVEWKTILNRRSDNDYEITRHGWCGDYNEASTFLNLFSDTPEANVGGFFDPIIDKLMDEATIADDGRRAAIYTMVEAYLQDTAAMIPLYNYSVAFLMKEGVKGWPLENVQQRWLAKNLYRVADQ